MKYAAQIAFYLVLLAVGLGVYRDYVISWARPTTGSQRIRACLNPRSAAMNCPVMLVFCSEHRKRARLATSASVGRRLKKVADSSALICLGLSIRRVIGVSSAPGRMALIR